MSRLFLTEESGLFSIGFPMVWGHDPSVAAALCVFLKNYASGSCQGHNLVISGGYGGSLSGPRGREGLLWSGFTSVGGFEGMD